MDRINESKEEFLHSVRGHKVKKDGRGQVISRSIVGTPKEFYQGNVINSRNRAFSKT